jgi:hypothetical protein
MALQSSEWILGTDSLHNHRTNVVTTTTITTTKTTNSSSGGHLVESEFDGVTGGRKLVQGRVKFSFFFLILLI